MNKNRNKQAFSMGEMMIVLLVLSIILAASMPIITKRSKSSVDKTWQAATNGSDAYFGVGETQGIAVGATGFPGGSFGKILLNVANASNSDVAHILFAANNSGSPKVLAKMRIGNSQIEFGANAAATAANTTAIGHETKTSGADAMAVGYSANASAANATAIGTSTKSAANSTSVGMNANADASGAVAVGYGGIANGTSATSIGAGSKATAESTVALGAGANSAAANSTAIGTSSVANNTNSTAFGFESNATAANSTAIGKGSVANAADALAIGYGTTASGAQSVALGSGANATGDYGIAIGSGVSAAANQLSLGASANITSIAIGSTGSVAGTQVITIGKTGSTVHLRGSVNANDVTVQSDARLKNIIGEYKSGLDDIMKIKTYEFTYKEEPKKKRVGVIAQELQKIFPNAVKKDDDGYLSIRKEDMFYAIINAIKELNQKVIALQNENRKLKKQVEDLSKRIDMLEKTK